jgi:hypothetical protein
VLAVPVVASDEIGWVPVWFARASNAASAEFAVAPAATPVSFVRSAAVIASRAPSAVLSREIPALAATLALVTLPSAGMPSDDPPPVPAVASTHRLPPAL